MENLISVFDSIRDIPYWIGDIHETRGMDCIRKHRLLKEKFEKEKVVCRLRSCIFYWKDLCLPKEILEIPHNETCDHTFLEIKNSVGQWIILDTTWDKGLSMIFPISKWDGENSTRIAMEFDYIASPEESFQLSKKWTDEYVSADLKKYNKFYTAINTWLESIRT